MKKLILIFLMILLAGVSEGMLLSCKTNLLSGKKSICVKGVEIPEKLETKVCTFTLNEVDEIFCKWRFETEEKFFNLIIFFDANDDKEEIENLIQELKFILSLLPEQEASACKFASEYLGEKELLEDIYLCGIWIYSENDWKKNGNDDSFRVIYYFGPKDNWDEEGIWPKYSWDLIGIRGDIKGAFDSVHYIGWQR